MAEEQRIYIYIYIYIILYKYGFEGNMYKRIWFLTLHESEHLEDTGIK